MPLSQAGVAPPARLFSFVSRFSSQVEARKIISRPQAASLPAPLAVRVDRQKDVCRTRSEQARGAPATSRPQPHHMVSTLESASLPESMSLLNLSFAQRRKDIRWRQEGFEMSSSDADGVPFALRLHTLVPLDIAFARSDIRRRGEEYESRAGVTSLYPDLQPQAPETADALFSPLSYQTITSHPPSLPSIYSHPSYTLDGDLHEGRDRDSVIALYDVYMDFSHDQGHGSPGVNVVADLACNGSA